MRDLVVSFVNLLQLLMVYHIGGVETLIQALDGFLKCLRVYGIAQLEPDLLLDYPIDFHYVNHHLFYLVDGPINIFKVEVVRLDHL